MFLIIMSSKTTSSWWDSKWNKDNICGISHTRLRPGTNKNGIPYTIQLPCKHRFYTNCLLHWMRINPHKATCPCCRQSFTLQDLIDYLSKKTGN